MTGCGVCVPRDLAPVLPGILWFFQMGVIFFWVTDESPEQRRTDELLELATKAAATLVQLSALPFMRPVRKTALQIVKLVSGAAYAVLGASFVLLLFALEGALCIVLSLPIVLPLGCL